MRKEIVGFNWCRFCVKICTFYFFIVVFSQSAYGSEAAKQLVKALGHENDFGSTGVLCESNVGILSARELLDINPEYFYGIKPDSKAWPEVLKILDSYYEELCNSFDLPSYLSTLEVLYDDLLDDESMRIITQFMKTEAGLKYVNATIVISEKMRVDFYQDHQKHATSASGRYKEKMLELVKEVK